MKVHQQISQGEDTRNQAKKSTSHTVRVRVKSAYDLIETVATLAGFERVAIQPDGEEYSALIDVLQLALKHLTRSTLAEDWFRKNEGCISAVHHLFLSLQHIFREFAAWASTPATITQARAAASTGYITDPSTISTLEHCRRSVAIASGWSTPNSIPL
jgi:hypothetical protein